MEFSITAMGVRQAQLRFSRLEGAAADASLLFLQILEMFYEIEKSTFDSQGRRGGGSWRAVTDEWMQRKMRNGLDLRINHANLTLRKSVTEPAADYQEAQIGPQHLRFGSTLPYAAVTQRNRPFIKLTARDKLLMRNRVRDYLMAAWELGVHPNRPRVIA